MKKQNENLKKEQSYENTHQFFNRPNRPTWDEHMKAIDEWAKHRFDIWDFEKTKQVILEQMEHAPVGTDNIEINISQCCYKQEQVLDYLKQNGFNPVFRREFNDLASPDEYVQVTIPADFKRTNNSSHSL